MITFSTVTAIDDTEFDRIYADSLAGVENGWPWHWWPDHTTPEQKKAFIRSQYDLFIDSDLAGSFVFSVCEDDRLLGLYAATLNDGVMEVSLSLFGLDITASKAWAYGNEQSVQARNTYWESLGISGWVFSIPDLQSDLRAFISTASGTLMGTVNSTQAETHDTPQAVIDERGTPDSFGIVNYALVAA
jgi:hypothetical protein